MAGDTENTWRWTCERGMAAIRRLAPAWNRLVHSGAQNPWSDALWMECYWGAFARRDADLVVHALFDSDRLVTVVPLLRRGGLLPRWSHAGNAHTSYWVIAWPDPRPEVAGRILDHLLSSVTLLDVRPVHSKGPVVQALAAAARERRLPVALEEYTGDVIIDVPSSWALCRERLSRNLRSGTARKLRGLERLGPVQFEVVEGGDALDRVLQECYQVETLGWKAVRGSPILASPETARFYAELASAYARAGRLAIYTLRVGGKLVAFEYCLRGQGTIEMLKLSFDPSFSAQSPGNVLRMFLLEKEASEGQITTYHMGRPADASGWKLRWATRVEPLARLRIYAPGMKATIAYHSGPNLRATLKRSPGIMRLRALFRAVAGLRRHQQEL
jgi:CelD/BcsL family acetyltransferase involved in cellulose biosynthesis